MDSQPASCPVPFGPVSGLLEHAAWPMATTEGPTHVVRYANPAFCHLLDKPAEQLLGRAFQEMLPAERHCLSLMERVYRLGQPESCREQSHSNEQSVFRSYAIWPVFANERAMGVVVQVTESEDVHTTTIEMNEALLLASVRQHELAEAADMSNAQLSNRAGALEQLVAERTSALTATNQQLEALIYSIAHDLRAPVRAIQGFSELLVAEAGATLNDAGKGYAGRIDRSAQLMDALLCDLLAFSRINRQRIELSQVKLGAVVEIVLSGLQRDTLEKNPHIETAGPWPSVLAHEPTLRQVLFNLASNAVKFSAPGTRPWVRLRAEEKAEVIRIWVEDHGIGIALDHQEQIFRIFTRLNGEQYPGTGIGLAIVHKGVERMGGRIGVHSVAGQGCQFWFELRKA